MADTSKNNYRLSGVFSLLRQVVALYKKHFNVILRSLSPALISFLCLIGIHVFGKNFLSGNLFGIVYVVLLIGTFVLSVIGNITGLYLIDNNALSMRQGLSETMHRLPSFVWTFILFIFSYYGAGVFLLIPSLIVYIYYFLFLFPVLFEKKNGTSALAASWFYVQGYWWAVLGRYLGLMICLYFILLCIQVPSIIFMDSLKSVPAVIQDLGLEASLIFMQCMSQMLMLVSYVLYKELLKEKGFAPLPSGKKVAFIRITAVLGFILPLLVIILLVAINPSEQITKANKTATLYKIQSIQQVLQSYHEENGSYPTNLKALVPSYISAVTLESISEISYMKTVDGDYSLCMAAQPENTRAECFSSKRPVVLPTSNTVIPTK